MDDKQLTRVVFLDYDGVVNTAMWDETGTRCRFNFNFDGKVNNFQAVQWLSEFCQNCHYSIVVTSTWRRYDDWKECLINGGLREGIEVIGKTDVLNGCRGEEIKKYLNEHPEIEYYLIIDDEADMLPEQMDHFVQTDYNVGFGIREFRKCLDIYKADMIRGGSFH